MYNPYQLRGEKLHVEVPAPNGDVCLRMLDGETFPSMAYFSCVDGSTARIYSRRISRTQTYEWTELDTLSNISLIGIEFNGSWQTDIDNQNYYFITESLPFLFYVDKSNSLYYKRLFDTEPPYLLATDVTFISICRGWQSAVEPTIDHGLVVGYLKSDGRVYYRALCRQNSGQSMFEDEENIALLESGNNSLCVYKLNDFRLGFCVERNGLIYNAITSRLYVGLGLSPDVLSLNIIGSFSMADVSHSTIASNDNGTIAISPFIKELVYYNTNSEKIAIVSSERLSTTQFKIILSKELYNLSNGQVSAVSITSPSNRTITDLIYNNSEKSITVTVNTAISIGIDIILNLLADNNKYYYIEPNMKFPLEDKLSVTLPRTITNVYGYGEPDTLSLNTSASFIYEQCYTSNCYSDNDTIALTTIASFEYIPVSGSIL